MLLGESGAGVSVPSGLSVGLLVLVAVFGVLGFLLYSVLFAAAGSLASRQEDVNQVIMPMMLLATAGYLVAIWSNIGVLDARSGFVDGAGPLPVLQPVHDAQPLRQRRRRPASTWR